MLRYLFGKMLESFHRRYNYDIRYQQEILATDKTAFLKWMAFQTMAAHAGQLPVEPLFAARLRAIIAEDCGPCTQLVVDLALEAKLAPELISAVIARDLHKLPEDIQLVVNFCDLVLARQPQANDLRAAIRARWGQSGLLAIAFALSSYRVYPALKYSLGYGEACHKVMVKQTAVLIHKANQTSQ